MAEFTKPLVLVSPPEHSERAGDAQSLLTHNRLNQDFHPGPIDKTYGPQAAGATHRAKYWAGYPSGAIDNKFGQQLYSYLLPLSSGAAAPLPLAFRLRRKMRLQAAAPTGKQKALANALRDVGVKESPAYSNCQKFGARYGMNCVAWCAIAVTCWMVDAGVAGFRLGARWSFVPTIVDDARAGSFHTGLTAHPEPGDLVTYTTPHGPNQHVEVFEKWIEGGRTFYAVGGNTSNGSTVEANGGEVCRNVRYVQNVTHYVRVGI